MDVHSILTSTRYAEVSCNRKRDCDYNTDREIVLFLVCKLQHATVDVNKMFTKSFTDHVSISDHQIREHELVTSVGGLQCFDVNFL